MDLKGSSGSIFTGTFSYALFLIIFVCLDLVNKCNSHDNDTLGDLSSLGKETGSNFRDFVLCRGCGSDLADSRHIFNYLSPQAYAVANRTLFGKKGVEIQHLINPFGVENYLITLSESSCVGVGKWQKEYSWYPGYEWKICLCRYCGIQHGWIFEPIATATADRRVPSKDGFYAIKISNLSVEKAAITRGYYKSRYRKSDAKLGSNTMGNDQQFCLKWNEHQSTLMRNFDTLLESGALVDCTLAAEGKYLKAHKLVLSACSTYFKDLLDEFYDKHPIVVLKDVKFNELEAMMDYMYRGEVNILESQLAALLSAAESLKIKGLSNSNSSDTDKPQLKQVNSRLHLKIAAVDHFPNKCDVENNCKVPRQSLEQTSAKDLPKTFTSQSNKICSSKDFLNPILGKRKKVHRSASDDNSVNRYERSSLNQRNTSSFVMPPLKEFIDKSSRNSITQNSSFNEKLMAPKLECLDILEDSDEDFGLINDGEPDMEEIEESIQSDPGFHNSSSRDVASEDISQDASIGSKVKARIMKTAETPDSVFADVCSTDKLQQKKQMYYNLHEISSSNNHSQLENIQMPSTTVLSTLTAQEMTDAAKGFKCQNCPSHFTYARSLRQHIKHECCQEPRLKCPYCPYRTKQSSNLYSHIRSQHKGMKVYKIKLS